MTKAFLNAVLATSIAALAQAMPGGAQAADSSKTVQIIVPYSAGGTTDRIARIVANGLTQELGETYVVVNKPGAGGTLGTAEVARAKPDGYTLGVVFDSQAVNQYMFKSLSYDTFKSFSYVTLVVSAPHVLVTGKSYPSLPALLQAAKAKPGTVSFGSTGQGTSNHLYPLLLGNLASVELLPVPYQGGGGSFLPDLLSGRYDMASGTLGYFLPYIKDGRLRAIATGGVKRSPLLPNVPTVAETYPGFEASSWVGLIAPAGLPKETADRLRNALRHALGTPALKEQLLAEGYDIEVSSSDAFVARVRNESERLGALIKDKKLGEQ
ncbi:Bug family tripartite tricarboxylate transporter substrate binding protein [Cupriavidus pauculus]|uniref:Tripartite tricarboxylate transporter substrate binding protein n=1 Tax=Cupriavidus pauculus TaxID=82633 RepID=A0A2N5C898_9BURK|nr:tripartite tricarboxylate transporter substrate-binding protein [Cupriavidus pauculus]PLP98443.1 tripartite tricarboxylate transporter substrate binding protein [Cupriavidus pauculus]